jgi:ribosomal protein L7/L12
MSEPLLVAAILAGAVAAVLLARLGRSRDHEARALGRVEAKLDAILKHQGIQFDPYAEVPPKVIEALQSGQKIEAIREYRVATGIGLKEAKERVEEIWRRAAPPV